MRNAWKVLVAGCLLPCRYAVGTAAFTSVASSAVVAIGFSSRATTIARAIRREKRSPPHPKRTSAIFSSAHSLTISCAVSVSSVTVSLNVIRSGSSRSKLKPRPELSSWSLLQPRSKNTLSTCVMPRASSSVASERKFALMSVTCAAVSVN